VWTKDDPDFRVADTRICYEFAQAPGAVKIVVDGRPRTVTVIPDGWLRVEHLKNGEAVGSSPILLEIDRGTAFQQKFRQHIYTRLEFVRGGEYKRIFETDAVTIAYVTTGSTDEFMRSRLAAMRAWTAEVLEELNMKDWASLFRFRALSPQEIYKVPLFKAAVWYFAGSAQPTSFFDR
jgi:hypothetical protein